MSLDDRGRRAAAEVREASREARFTVRAPGNSRWRAAVVALASAAIVLAVGVPLLLLYGPWTKPVTEVPVTTSTLAPTTTQGAATTVSVPGKTPAASVGEVILAIHAAVNESDDGAYRGVVADGSFMFFYLVHGLDPDSGPGTLGMGQLLPSSLEQVMETGEVVVSGHAGAAALRLVYPDPEPASVGFNTFVAEPVAGGFLYAGGAWIAAEESGGYAEADPAVVAGLLADQAAAWAVGDIAGVLAGYWEYAKYIDGFAYRAHGPAELADFYAGMRLEFTGEPVISGPFFAVATRVTDQASGVATDGVSVYWVREGQIALHVLTTGT